MKIKLGKNELKILSYLGNAFPEHRDSIQIGSHFVEHNSWVFRTCKKLMEKDLIEKSALGGYIVTPKGLIVCIDAEV